VWLQLLKWLTAQQPECQHKTLLCMAYESAKDRVAAARQLADLRATMAHQHAGHCATTQQLSQLATQQQQQITSLQRVVAEQQQQMLAQEQRLVAQQQGMVQQVAGLYAMLQKVQQHPQ
jgi:hydroxymethylpyrimidine/phosphomethylpyrimidine kinase